MLERKSATVMGTVRAANERSVSPKVSTKMWRDVVEESG
jgi:hypothetical protein